MQLLSVNYFNNIRRKAIVKTHFSGVAVKPELFTFNNIHQNHLSKKYIHRSNVKVTNKVKVLKNVKN